MSDAELNRYLNRLDQEAELHSAVALLAEQWLSHPEKVNLAWAKVFSDQRRGEQALILLSDRSLRSGRFFGLDELDGNYMFLEALDDLMFESLKDLAEEHMRSEADQAKIDRMEDSDHD